AAALTVIFGWVLSSQAAREFLRDSPFAVWAGCAILAILGAILAIANLFLARREGRRMYERLAKLGYMEEAFFASYRLSPRLFWSVVAFNALLCALILIGVVYSRFG